MALTVLHTKEEKTKTQKLSKLTLELKKNSLTKKEASEFFSSILFTNKATF